MSRLASMSPAALRALFAPESSDDLVMLLTLTGGGIVGALRLADNFTHRLSETDEDVVYGITSRGNDYTFLPMQVTLPAEQAQGTMSCQVVLHDARQQILPAIRSLTEAPLVTLEVVLKSTPDTVEASFPGFYFASTGYNAGTITGVLSYQSYDTEPFPAHTFNPNTFPGLF